jgi:hypothetical protein
MPELRDPNRGPSAAELMHKRAAEEAARAEWMDVYCPGCRTGVAIDIRTIDRHPLASVGSLVLGLRCSLCPGSAPMPVLRIVCCLIPGRSA